MKEMIEKEKKRTAEDDFADLPDMDDDASFRAWLEEEYFREADQIEEALFADGSYEENLPKAEELRVSRESFYDRLKAEGLLDKETDEDAEVSSPKVVPIKKKETKSVRRVCSSIRLGKVAGVAGVCLLCIFSATMSSEANRNYFIEGIRYLAGDDTRVVVDNDENNEVASTDEYEAIQEIEDKLGAKVPEFYYRPEGMNLYKYVIDEPASAAKMEFTYKDNILTLFLDKQSEDTASNINSLTGEEKEVDSIHVDGIEIKVNDVKEESDILATYIARWEYDNTFYYMSGKINLDELEKILKFMKF